MMRYSLVFVAACALLFGGDTAAQDSAPLAARATPSATIAALSPSLEPRLEAPPVATQADLLGVLPLPKYGAWVGVTKWLTLGAAAGLGAYGFTLHADANDAFSELQRACEADGDNCRRRNPDGSYVDPRLETLYQDVIDKDGQARLTLIGAQLSFGVSVLLFIVDFQKDEGPNDIPYDPDGQRSPLRLTAVPGELAVRYYFR